MPERLLGPGQIKALDDVNNLLVNLEPDGVISIVARELQEVYKLPRPEALTVIAILYLIFKKTKNEVDIDPKFRKQCKAAFINSPPGEGQLWQENHGVKHIPKGRYPTGRNRGGRLRGHR